jgi:hypothetical protein
LLLLPPPPPPRPLPAPVFGRSVMTTTRRLRRSCVAGDISALFEPECGCVLQRELRALRAAVCVVQELLQIGRLKMKKTEGNVELMTPLLGPPQVGPQAKKLF